MSETRTVTMTAADWDWLNMVVNDGIQRSAMEAAGFVAVPQGLRLRS